MVGVLLIDLEIIFLIYIKFYLEWLFILEVLLFILEESLFILEESLLFILEESLFILE